MAKRSSRVRFQTGRGRGSAQARARTPRQERQTANKQPKEQYRRALRVIADNPEIFGHIDQGR